MIKNKTILLFSDLEGTILGEEDGNYDSAEMYKFLEQIDRLQQLTGANVSIHLVSPVFKEQMKEVIKKIDGDIATYNNLHKEHDRISEIECGTYTTVDGLYGQEDLEEDRLMPLKKPVHSEQFDSSLYGKCHYVQTWVEMYEDRGKLLMPIYCGNGQNDLAAMRYIKNNKKGFVVCPNNSRHLAKDIANFVGKENDLSGITEGLKCVNNNIELRNPNPELDDDAR